MGAAALYATIFYLNRTENCFTALKNKFLTPTSYFPCSKLTTETCPKLKTLEQHHLGWSFLLKWLKAKKPPNIFVKRFKDGNYFREKFYLRWI